MKTFLFLFVLGTTSSLLYGQCTVQANAAEMTNLVCVGGTTYRSGVAFNPNFNIYYSVNSGSSGYSIETFDVGGVPLSTIAQGFDYRGLWWNSNLNQLDGNGYSSSGIFVQNLDGSNGYPLGTGTTVISGMNQPFAHSCGQFDPVNNEIIYYYAGNIERYSRPTGAYISATPITGLPVPVGNLNTTSIGYTGCSGMEVVVYDYILQRVYFINLSTGAYVTTSQLPATAPTESNQRVSYANDLFWLFDTGTMTWKSYGVVSTCADTYGSISTTSCDSYTSPSGIHTWTSTGVYTDTIANSAGCDSVITINLTINSVNVNVTQSGLTLTAAATGATYQWLDCLNNYQAIPGQTNQTYTVSTNGGYAVQVTQNGCTDTSICLAVAGIGLEEILSNDGLLVYPNPSKDGMFNIELTQGKIENMFILDALGKLVELPIHLENKMIDGSKLSSGTYILVVQTDLGTYRKQLMVID